MPDDLPASPHWTDRSWQHEAEGVMLRDRWAEAWHWNEEGEAALSAAYNLTREHQGGAHDHNNH